MVTGTTTNGTDTPAGWAAFFLDHSSVLPGRRSEQLRRPAHCSYDRRALLAVGGFPDDVRAGEDTAVNHALFTAGLGVPGGRRAAGPPQPVTTPWRFVRHHFGRGRALTQFIAAHADGADARARTSSGYPTRRLARIDENVQAWGGDLRPRYRRVRPLVGLGVLSAWVGGYVELARPSCPFRARQRRRRQPIPPLRTTPLPDGRPRRRLRSPARCACAAACGLPLWGAARVPAHPQDGRQHLLPGPRAGVRRRADPPPLRRHRSGSPCSTP